MADPTSAFVPIRYILPWPEGLFRLPEAEDGLPMIDRVGLSSFDVDDSNNGYIALRAHILLLDELSLEIPGLTGSAVVFGAPPPGGAGGAGAEFDVTLAVGETVVFGIENVDVALRLQQGLLAPVSRDMDGAWARQQLPDGSPKPFGVRLEGAGVRVDAQGDVDLTLAGGAPGITIDAFMIGDTGVVVEAENIKLDLSQTSSPPEVIAAGFDKSFVGVFIGNARVHLPDDWPSLAPEDLILKNCAIGSGGVSGKLIANYTGPDHAIFDEEQKIYSGKGAGTLFGMPFWLKEVDIEFKQNALKSSHMSGEMFLPYFDKRIAVELGLNLDGSLSIQLAGSVEDGDTQQGNGLVTLHKEGLFDLVVDSIGFQIQNDRFVANISGDITLLVFKDQINWPTFHVDNLSIDSKGHVNLPGGWLETAKQKPISFYGFELAITKLGFGHSEDGGRWIGFSGGIKLVEGLPMGASVEGLRITWYDDGRPNPIAVTLNGVGVEFTIPDVLAFKGQVSYNTIPKPTGGEIHRFDGAITLDIKTINLQIDSVLVVGSDTGPEGRYNFFAIYTGVELPSGIPLGNTGVAIFGFAGLFAYQMEPNKGRHDLNAELPTDEGWYENEDGSPGWYKRNEMGVTDLKNKWDPVRDSLAFGVGATLGTMSDGGTAFHGKFLLAIVFPGPIIMLEGRGNLLKKRTDAGGESKTTSEPLFRSIAVLDFRLGTLTFGLSAWYKYNEEGSVIDITGSAEAFFDFNNPGGWHVYIGREEPQQYRVHAFILNKLFEANSYFMLSKGSFKTGVWVGLKYGWKYGPLTAAVDVSLDGKAAINHKPPQYYGHLLIRGSLVLAAFGYGVTIVVEAEASADVFNPYHIMLLLSGELKLPWPLHSFKVDYKKEWGPLPLPPPLPLPLKELAIEHPIVSTTWPLSGDAGLLRPIYDDGNGFLREPADPGKDPDFALIPVVPLDARPHLNFARHVNDDAGIAVNPQPGDLWERIGDPEQNKGPARARFGLRDVVMEKWDAGAAKWSPVASASGKPKKLDGAWAPLPGPDGGVAQNRLMLYSKNAFDYTRHGGRAWSEGFAADNPTYPCVSDVPEHEFCCDFSELEPGQILQSPWRCPQHPEITLTWSAGGDPVVTVLDPPVDGLTRALCFPGSVDTGGGPVPNDIVIGFPAGRPARKVTVTPAGRDNHMRECLYFEGRSPGAGPTEERGVQFSTNGARGSRITPVGAISGLDCGSRLVLVLPRACLYAELTLSTQAFGLANPPVVVANRRSGPPVTVPMIGSGPELLRMHGPDIVDIVVSAPAAETLLHQLCLEYALVDGEGVDGAGNRVPCTISDASVLTLEGNGLQTVHLKGGERICMAQVCVVLPPDPAEVAQQQAMMQHFQSELARWYQEDDLLELDTVYRLTVVTTIEAHGEGKLDGWQPSPNPLEQKQYAYFRTEGPPGFSRLSLPAGTSPDGQDVLRTPTGKIITVDKQGSVQEIEKPGDLAADSRFVFKSALNDLTPYVRQTVPSTVPAPGQLPPLPRPVYRAYDTGVEFNANYVDLMYRLRRRGLALYLFDNNNQPARDAEGRLIVLANRWGAVERLWLSESELLWIGRVNANDCGNLDVDKIPHDKTLSTSDSGLVLDADTVYEGRLLPLFLDEDFSQGLDSWRVVNQGDRSAPTKPDNWQVRKSLAGSKATAADLIVSLDGAPDLSAVDVSVDMLLLDTDQARASRGYRIVAVDNAGKKVTLDGNPKLAGGKSAWRIPLASVEQHSFINGGPLPLDGRDPNKPGTMLLAGDPSWTDYRFAVTVRSWDDGAVGVVFRVQDSTHYYRFDMSRDHRYRRLVRVRDNENRILGEDYFVFQTNRDYRLTVEAVRERLRVYIDDEMIFDVEDDTLPKGGVGLYCWQNAGTRFADVRVDDFRQDAPVVYRYKFTTSRFTNFFHHLHSFQDEIWQAAATRTALDAAVAGAASLSVQPSDDEGRAYQNLLDTILAGTANQNPPQVQATRIEQGGATRALLIQSPEPIDWSRTKLEIASTDRPARQSSVPGAVKLTDVELGGKEPKDEWVDLLVREPVDLNGYRIEYCAFAGTADAELLFADSFSRKPAGLLFDEVFGPAALDRYEIIAEDPPSGGISGRFAPDWKVANNRIEQRGSYRGGTPAGDNLPARPGTIALSKAGSWSDVRIRATLHSASSHDIGLVFRCQDKDNYYRFSASRSPSSSVSSFRRLVKKVNGTVQVLWQDDRSALTYRPCHLVIETLGDHLIGYLDDELLFSLHDPSFTGGQAGFYCWGNSQAFFEGLQIEALEADPVLWQPGFTDLSEVTLVEEPHLAGMQADWQVEGGALLQLASFVGLEGKIEELPGVARDITISPDGDVYVVGVDSTPKGYGIYHWNGVGWDRLGGDAVRIAAGTGGSLLWINNAGQVFLSSPTFPGGYLTVPSPITDVALGPDGTPWLVGSDVVSGGYKVYRWNGTSWDDMGVGALRVDIGPDGRAWIVTDEAFIYVYDGSAWKQIAGSANDIAVGADGSIWCMTDTGSGADFAICCWDGAGWETMLGVATAIAVAPDGQPWLVDAIGRISRWHGSPLHQPGTYALGGDPGWQDVCISARLRSTSDGAMGVMLRYKDADNYYRLAMDSRAHLQRLVKRVNGEMVELWQRTWTYQLNRPYELTLQAVGAELRGYLDGELLFMVYDGDLRRGRVGLYCRANDGARFERLVVADKTRRVGQWTIHDEGDQDAPSVWRLSGGALTQTSAIRGIASDAPGAYALTGRPDWTDIRLTARLRSDDPGAIGVLFRYVDADNYYRFAMDQASHFRRLIKKTGGNVTVLWEDTGRGYTVGDVYILTVEAHGAELAIYLGDVRLCAVSDGTHKAGQVGIYCANNPSARFEDVAVTVYPTPKPFADHLLQDQFTTLEPGRWSFEDRGDFWGPSDWSVQTGELRQSSGISFRPRPWRRDPGQPGTLALAGSRTWTDYRLSVTLGSYHVLGGSSVEIGVIFRYQDADNYYWFRVNHETGYRQLLRRVSGQVTLLWQQLAANNRGQAYRLDIDCLGQNLRGYLDGALLFDVVDKHLPSGQVGLACTANAGAFFTSVSVVPPAWRLYYTFRDERRLAAGSRLRIFSSSIKSAPAAEPGLSYRFVAAPYETGTRHFPADGVDIRLLAPDSTIEHQRTVLGQYSPSALDWRILRKADGTGFFLVRAGCAAIPAASYRLALTYNRDNRQNDPDSQALSQAGSREPERVNIDIPWQSTNA